MKFSGFTKETFDFLLDMVSNNYKGYFEERRENFELQVKAPLVELEKILARFVLTVDPTLVTGLRAISRIYRDTRFSKDKSPLRDHMWIAYKHRGRGLGEEFAFYFEISPVGYAYGVGMYATNLRLMNSLRDRAKANPAKFSRIVKKLDTNKNLTLKGENYIKPKVNDVGEDVEKYLNKKFFFLSNASGDIEKACTPYIADEVLEAFRQCEDIYKYVYNIG